MTDAIQSSCNLAAAALLGFCVAATTTASEPWPLLAQEGGMVARYNPASKSSDANGALVFEAITDYDQPLSTAAGAIRSLRMRLHADCTRGEVTMTDVQPYSRPGGQGSAVGKATTTPQLAFTRDDVIGRDFLDRVCQPAAPQPKTSK